MNSSFTPHVGTVNGARSRSAAAAVVPRRKLLAVARQARLGELVSRRGYITVAETAVELDVSEMTIRRDLEQLQQQGIVARAHGGAMSARPARPEPETNDETAFAARQLENGPAKARIVEAALSLIQQGDAIGVDCGTTPLLLAQRLAARPFEVARLRVFTNNLRAAAALADSPFQVYVLGGQIRPHERSVFGPAATAQVRQFCLDRVFVGVSALSTDAVYDYAMEDLEVKRAFIDCAREVILLCDSSKFGRRRLVRVCDLARIHVLITDAPPPADLAEALAAAGVRTIVAPPLTGRPRQLPY